MTWIERDSDDRTKDGEDAKGICAVCRQPVDRSTAQYVVEGRQYHPECYDRERRKEQGTT